MYPKLLHIYGPLFLQSYGVCIALGLALFYWLLLNDKRRRMLMNDDQFHNLLLAGVLSAIIGGRALYFMTEGNLTSFYEFFELWYGGFAVLGSLLGVLLVIPFLLKKYKLPTLALLDRAALYAPLLQSISRIGCFLSGCCYGKPSGLAWAVTYTNHECMAPLGIAVHPTQLYSALFLAVIFFILYTLQDRIKKPGQLMMAYLIFMGFERFFVDFFRDDQTYFYKPLSFFSDHQYIALIVIFCASFYLVNSSRRVYDAKPL
jgi:phosphatidylglycerol---prolipoprotein diacylglyceryl transferase